jgi:hypothetical protein
MLGIVQTVRRLPPTRLHLTPPPPAHSLVLLPVPLPADVALEANRVYRTTYMFSATMPPAVERLARWAGSSCRALRCFAEGNGLASPSRPDRECRHFC